MSELEAPREKEDSREGGGSVNVQRGQRFVLPPLARPRR